MSEGDDRAGPDPAVDDADSPPARPRGRSAAEWVTFAVSALVVAALVGVALAEQFLWREPAGARVSVVVATDRAEKRDGRFYVPFTAANDGAAPATDVAVIFEMRQGATVIEESTADIPFLPVDGAQDGELVTALDPATHEIVARVGTLQAP